MSRLYDTQQFEHPLGAVIMSKDGYVLIGQGTTVPTDATPGYAVGALFFDLDGADGSQWYRNDGTAASCDFNVLNGGIDLSTLTATAANLNVLSTSSLTMATTAGTGITAGSGTVYRSNVERLGTIIKTSILIDLTGLTVEATDNDIIGVANVDTDAHLGQITAAKNGTIFGGTVTCLEVPTTGSADINLWSADEATGSEGDAISGLTGEAALVDAGGAWTLGEIQAMSAIPAANQYLYLTNGAAANAGLYDAGKFLIEFYGYDA